MSYILIFFLLFFLFHLYFVYDYIIIITLQQCQRRTEPWTQAICTENLLSSECGFWDMLVDIQTDRQTCSSQHCAPVSGVCSNQQQADQLVYWPQTWACLHPSHGSSCVCWPSSLHDIRQRMSSAATEFLHRCLLRTAPWMDSPAPAAAAITAWKYTNWAFSITQYHASLTMRPVYDDTTQGWYMYLFIIIIMWLVERT